MADPLAPRIGGIAVIGLACRVPGADTAGAFWNNLVDGVESIRRFTSDELIDAGIDPTEAADPAYVPAKGVLEHADHFDAALFGYAPREASLMDPQHRVMLECAWEALEHAGYGGLPSGARVAVYAGVALNTYMLRNVFPHREMIATEGEHALLVGNDKDFVPTRISYQLGLVGPSVNVQTACSTSLVAVQIACQSLLTHQCDMALAGGAAVTVPLVHGYAYREGGILSSDGHCRPFDARAGGTVPGNGAGIVLLKRVEDAVADGDTIHAVIAGSAINNDGADKVGYTAPSIAGQGAVIAQALALAGVRAETVGFVEAHGTGTPLGDPIEVAALTAAFRKTATQRGYCALGSVKSNIGHLDTAAGVIGLIKAVLAVREGVIPPSLHFERPNPALELEASPFYVPTTTQAWSLEGPRRACVSSFGIGGTNAHVVIEQAPAPRAPAPTRRTEQVLCVSARTGDALAQGCARLAGALGSANAPLADVAFTLARGRRALPRRRAVVSGSVADAAAQLAHPARDIPFVSERTVAWMFPGRCAAYQGLGAAIAEQEPKFRDAFAQVAAALVQWGTPDVREGIVPTARAADATLFAVEYALARLWSSWGLEPAVMLGDGVGELAAAVIAGVMTLEDAARLVTARGRADFRAEVSAVTLQAPQIPWVSSTSGTFVDAASAVDPAYWVRQTHEPTGLSSALRVLLESTEHALIEVGPGDALTTLARGQASAEHVVASSCGPVGEDETAALAQAVGTLWAAGVTVDWRRYYGAQTRGRVPLPTYPFDRQRYWIDPPAVSPEPPSPSAGSTEALLFEPTWVGAAALPTPSLEGRWLVLPDKLGIGAALADRVIAGGGFARLAERTAVDELAALLEDAQPDYVVHLGNVTGATPIDRSEARACGYDSVSALGTTLARSGAHVALTVVSDGMQTVTAQDVVCAEKALVLGPVRVLPQEHPALRCRSVDIEPAGIGEERLGRLLAECASDDAEPVVAHRGRHRFVPTFRRTRSPSQAPTLRREGVVLITGGTGGVGLTLARHLWETTGAKLILTGRTPLPADDEPALSADDPDDRVTIEIDDTPPAASPIDALVDARAIAAADAHLEAMRTTTPITERGDVAPLLDELSISLVYEFLGASGIDLRPGTRVRFEDLRGRLGVLPAYARYLDFFVQVLVEDGFARRDGDEFVIERAAPAPSAALRTRVVTRHPWLELLVQVLTHAAAHYHDVLAGRADALSVLYASGDSGLLERVVTSMADHTRHEQYGSVIASMLQRLAAASTGAPLRILEVGGGNGFLTRQVVLALAGTNVEYVFTDISRAFVDRARDWAAAQGFDHVTFGVYDIAGDAAAQGWRDPFDVVLALDVVHATKDVGASLSALRGVLRPDGVLYLLETLPPARWNTMVWGLFRDWWSFDDRFRTDSPLLSKERWLDALCAAGFRTAGAHTSRAERADCALYFAQNDVARVAEPRSKSAELAALREAGADVLTLTADATSVEQMTDVVSSAVRRFGALHGVVHAASERVQLGRAAGSVFGAKARGARVLEQVLAGQPLDFLLLCSSTSALAGGLGASKYVAENAFLDAFAHERAQRSFPVVSVNWAGWKTVGMARDVEDRYAARMGEALPGALTVPQALACFDRVAAHPVVPQLVASTLDFAAAPRVPLPDIESVADRVASAPHHPRQAMSTPFEEPLSDVERQVASVWEEALGVSPIGRHDDYLELGGDSLIAIKVVSRLRDALGLELRVEVLFEMPTVATLAQHAETLRWAAAPASAVTDGMADDGMQEGEL